MADGSRVTSQSRRDLLKGVAGGTALFAGLGANSMVAGAIAKEAGAPRPLKAAF